MNLTNVLNDLMSWAFVVGMAIGAGAAAAILITIHMAYAVWST